ncbi:MAG: tol-pal system protein YbgF [Gammaproteobacteria bacterium]|nr:tol-pal system protein YbgF [Gammaproteobacteria bacterium]
MKNTVHHTIIAACLGCCLSWPAFAEAPVVDESENYALFDEQLAAAERPDTFMHIDDSDLSEAYEENDNVALAHEENPTDSSLETTTLLNKVQGLQQELSELRGQLEVQTHALQTLKQQQLDFYKDLDTRLRDNGQTTTLPDSTQNQAQNTEQPLNALPINTAPRGKPADEQISYLAAYELVKNKEFDKALMAMKSFIQHYPRGGYTANAHYWLGELYMTKKAFPDAIQQFETVLSTFPNSSKSSASSLKLGYALAEMGQKSPARERLKAVIRDYPDTHAAKLAASKLKTLSS